MSRVRREEFLGLDGFVWFFGVVEDRIDPLKLGRVRVRCYGWHSSDKQTLPTDNLPWASVMQSTASAAMGDVGSSPAGLVEGSWVVGFFIDGRRAQFPIVMGSLPGIPQVKPSSDSGFSDPRGVYPRRLDEPDVNRLARGDSQYPHSVLDAKRTDALNAPVGRGWSLPTGTYSAKYPYNHVMETEAGHILELDDTAGAERVHVYHKSGTYVEVGPKGDVAIRTVGSRYESTTGDAHSAVGGTVSVTVEGPVTVRSSSYVLVDSKDVRLGGSGGPAVARVGDSVKTPAGLGTIISGSSQVTAV